MNLSQFNFQPSPISDFMQTAMIDVGEGIELCVEIGGNPNHPAIVLIMGLGAQLIFWRDEFLQSLIQQGFFVIRFDNRDIGLSTKISHHRKLPSLFNMMLRFNLGLSNPSIVPYTLIDMADDTARLIQCLGLSKTYVIGASMGGMIGQILAAKYPDLVSHLGLIFTSNNRPFLPASRPKQLKALFQKPKSHRREDVVEFGKKFMQAIGSPNYLDLDEVERLAGLRYDRCYDPKGTYQQMYAIFATGSLVKYNQQTKQPTVIIHGKQDGLLPYQHGYSVYQEIQGSRFYVLDQLGHDLPKPLMAQITQILTDHYINPL